MPAQQVGQLRCGCLVRNLAHPRARLRDEQLHAHFAGGARIGRGHGDPVGLRLACADQVLQGPVGRGLADHDDVGRFRHQPDRREVLVDVVHLLLEQEAVQDEGADVGIADGVAVGSGAHHGLGADPPAGADAVLDDHGLAQLLAHFLPDQAGRDVGIAARRGGNDHRDGAGRKILGLYAGTGQRQRAGQGIA